MARQGTSPDPNAYKGTSPDPNAYKETKMSTELVVAKRIQDDLPASIRQSLGTLSPPQQVTFEEDYKRKRRSKALYFVIALVFPIQHFLLGRVGLGILFWITWGGFGLWWLIELLFTPFRRITEYNETIARELMRDLKIMSA